MNGDQTLNIIIKAKDQASATLDKFKGKVEGMQPAFRTMAAVGTAAFVGIAAVAYKSITAYAEVERSQRQLEHAIIGISKGTREQVVEIERQVTALEKKAGVDADSLKMGVAQLATFGLQGKNVVALTKSLADLTVNQNGLNASGDQYVASANIMAKAMRGEFGMLQKMGIRFTEHQQELIKTGTETQKVAAITEGLAQNLRETTDTVGGVDLAMAKLQRAQENITEGIGKALAPALAGLLEKLQPIIERFADWADKHPELIAKIVLLVGGLAGLVAVIGIIGIALPAIIAGFALLASPITLTVIAVTAVIAGFVLAKDKMVELADALDEKTGIITLFKWAWDQIYAMFVNNLMPAIQQLWESLKPLEPILTLIAKVVGVVLIGAVYAITLAITGWVQVIGNIIALGSKFAANIIDFFVYPIKTFIDMVKSAIEYVGYLIDKMSKVGGGIKGAVSSVGKKVGKILGFEHGGTVPGAIGQAVPIIAHGGEEVIPAGRARNGGGGSNIILNLNYPQFKSKEDIDVVRAQLELAMRDVVRIYKLQPA